MAVLYAKYFLCSIRRFSCLPPTISLQSLIFLQFSPLSSAAFPATPSLSVVPKFLTKECGFSPAQVTTLMRRRPHILKHISDHNAREVIHILIDSGLTESQVKKTIIINPSILSFDVDGLLKPKIEFLKKLLLAPQDMATIISRCPRLLELSLENSLTPRTLHLRSLFGSDLHLFQAIKKAPGLLTTDFEKQVKPKVEYLKTNIGILEGSTLFLQTLRVVLGLSFENLENKTKNLASLGLAEEEIRLILRGNPSVLQSSTKKIKENMDFLIHTAGLTPEIVASHPVILNFSVDKRLKPRFEFFKYLRANPHCKSPPSLVDFFTLSEKRMIKYFGQYSSQV